MKEGDAMTATTVASLLQLNEYYDKIESKSDN